MSYNKGTKKNPYTTDELQQVDVNAWHGGWVIVDSDTPRFFDVEFNMIPSIIGSRTRPFPEDLYSQMMEWGLWAGGYTYNHDVLVYITTSGTISHDNEHPLGHMDNPYPYEAFEEMRDNEFWRGGWVEFPDGSNQNIHNFTSSASSSGSGGSSNNSSNGSGSGSGCGCGNNNSSNNEHPSDPINSITIQSGETLFTTLEGGGIYIYVCWSAGKTQTEPYSIPYARIVANPNKYKNVTNDLDLYWNDNNQIVVHGSISYCKKTDPNTNEYTIYIGNHFVSPF